MIYNSLTLSQVSGPVISVTISKEPSAYNNFMAKIGPLLNGLMGFLYFFFLYDFLSFLSMDSKLTELVIDMVEVIHFF